MKYNGYSVESVSHYFSVQITLHACMGSYNTLLLKIDKFNNEFINCI